MNTYKANASVIYTDEQGSKFDTFVIFDTDRCTGLPHINHENKKVGNETLQLHAKTVSDYYLPIKDAFSFEMLKALRGKYAEIDARRAASPIVTLQILAEAS